MKAASLHSLSSSPRPADIWLPILKLLAGWRAPAQQTIYSPFLNYILLLLVLLVVLLFFSLSGWRSGLFQSRATPKTHLTIVSWGLPVLSFTTLIRWCSESHPSLHICSRGVCTFRFLFAELVSLVTMHAFWLARSVTCKDFLQLR